MRTKSKKFKWVFELTVDPVWVADGFDPDAFNLKEAVLAQMLGNANYSEVRVRLIKEPARKDVAAEQGFKTVKALVAADHLKRVKIA